MVADSQGSTETLRCDNCSNAPSCCYARANYQVGSGDAQQGAFIVRFWVSYTASYGSLILVFPVPPV